MTVAAGAAKAGPYDGNDVASSFAFAFKVFADADIRVVETVIATEVETDLVLNTNYTVTRNNDQDNDPGGSITYKVGGVTTALPSTKKLTIVGDFDYEQPTDLPDGGGFRASVVERALDRVTMLVKQLKEKVDRAALVPVSSTTYTADDLSDDLAIIAGSVAEIATVAGISTSVTTVAGNSAGVTTCATNIAAIVAAPTQATNAAASATAAAASASSAQAIVDSVGFRDVVFITSANSPYTIAQAQSGKLISCDTSGGAITVNMPTIAGLTLPFTCGVKKTTGDANTVTIARGGTDTFDDGTTSQTLSTVGGMTLIPDTDTSPDKWTIAQFGAATGQQMKQQFTAGVGFTAGVSTTVTLTETPLPSSKDALSVHFDAAYQQESEWAYNAGTGVVTFNSAIPVGVAKIETKWTTPLAIGTPADGTVSTSKIADASVTNAKLAADVFSTAHTWSGQQSITSSPLDLAVGQLAFPAVQNPSAGGNTLDDYEEGTFTPTIVGLTSAGAGTYTTQLGKYTKIGNLVTFSITIAWTAHTGTGALATAGLPFVSANDGIYSAISIGYVDALALTAGNIPMAFVSTNSAQIWFYQTPTGGGAAAVVPLDTAATLRISGHYFV